MRRLMIIAALFAASCAPAIQIDRDAAERLLADMSRGGGDETLCTAEGRRMLRAAVQTISREKARDGEVWPDIRGVLAGSEAPGLQQATVAAALLTGVVRPSDLSSEARDLWAVMTFAVTIQPDAHAVREGLYVACPDVMALHRTLAHAEAEFARNQRSLARAERRDNYKRAAEIRADIADDAEETREDVRTIMRRIRQKIAERNGV